VLSAENKPFILYVVMLSVIMLSVVMLTVVAPLEIHSLIIDKLQPTGQNLSWVFNCRSVRVHTMQLPYFEMNLPKLKLKILPKQLLVGYFPLDIMLPTSTEQRTFLNSNKSQRGQLLDGKHYQNYEEENWRNSNGVKNFYYRKNSKAFSYCKNDKF